MMSNSNMPFLLNLRNSHPLCALLIVTLTMSSCAGPHYDWTREFGLFPPNLDERGDFYADAKKRCETFEKTNPSPECIRFWEAMLWAQDYRSFVGARARINRDVIYWGGVLALAGAGALLGLAAFGQTSSDAYKIIPIAATFLGGVLAFSKNDALYEAYEAAGIKIDAALRDAESKIQKQTPTEYLDAATALRRDAGNAVDELTQKKIDIVKFQSKSEADQFKAAQEGGLNAQLNAYQLKSVKTDIAAGTKDPHQVIATLNTALDTNLTPSELRLRLSDVNSDKSYALRLSAASGVDLTADIPVDLTDHGTKNYRVEVLARNGSYTIRDGVPIQLIFSQVRANVAVTGTGTIAYSDQATGAPLACSPNCDRLPAGKPTSITATPTGGAAHYTWTVAAGAACPNNAPCVVNPTADVNVKVEFTP